MSHSGDIALLTRRFRLLAQRVEYMSTNKAELVERILNTQVPLGELDRTLILHAGELDRLCAHVVRVLANSSSAAVLDVLGVLSPERIVAMYYALPNGRREKVRRDPAWGYHIDHAPTDMPEALAEVERIAQFTQELAVRLAELNARAEPGDRRATEAQERALLRRDVGLA